MEACICGCGREFEKSGRRCFYSNACKQKYYRNGKKLKGVTIEKGIVPGFEFYNADCLDILSSIGSKSVDMVLADPPYETTNASWDKLIPIKKLWIQLKRIVKNDGAILLFAQSHFEKKLAMSNPNMFRYEWIWRKNKATGFLNAKRMPMRNHEVILVFYESLPFYDPQKTDGHQPMNSAVRSSIGEIYRETRLTKNEAGTTKRYPKTVLEFDVVNNDSKDRIHSTQKPVDLCRYLIRTYSRPGETILDFCFGSRSTAIGCAAENRKFIGMEKDREKFKSAMSRIQNSNEMQMSVFDLCF